MRTTLAIIAAVFCCPSVVLAAIPDSERAVLDALFSQTGGTVFWYRTGGWGGAAGTECGWEGVRCDVQQTTVTGLVLDNNGLYGELPALDGLPNLQDFSAFGNALTGSIPSLQGLPALRTFSVYANLLVGPLPVLDGLTQLQSFDAGRNRLTGTIPALTGATQLGFFDVNGNRLSGPIPDLAGMSAMYWFDVGNNQLSGGLPSFTGTDFTHFDASLNQLSGTLSALPPAGELDLGNNLFSGSIPPIQRTFSRLNLNRNQFSGPIPALTMAAPGATLDLSYNALSGTIPSLAGLAQVDVSHNQLTGPLPDFGTDMFVFRANHNQLGGTITQVSAQDFQVDDNALSGPIPSLQMQTSLATFSARNNALNGQIPTLTHLYQLTYFDVSYNALSGSLSDLSGAPLLNLFVGGNQLSGALPTAPTTLWPGSSAVCPNDFDHYDSAAWDAATGATPWFANCASAMALVEIAISVKPSTYVPGYREDILYTLTLSNDAAVAATGVGLQMAVPPGLAGDGWYCYGFLDGDGRHDVVDFVMMPAHSSAHCVMSAHILPTATGTIAATATLTPPRGASCAGQGSCSALAEILPVADAIFSNGYE